MWCVIIKKKSKLPVQTKYFVYPANGGTKSLGIGDLTIDFRDGKVVLPNGTEEFLSNSLKSYGFKSCKSILIRTDKSIDVGFNSHGRIRVTALFGMNHLSFQTVYLHILETTSIAIFASNSPNVNFFF